MAVSYVNDRGLETLKYIDKTAIEIVKFVSYVNELQREDRAAE